MRIGIISDLHGYPEQFRKALRAIGDCHMILCAGDILYHGPRNPILHGYDPQGLAEEISKNEVPMLIARGNCDAEVDLMVLKLPVYIPAIVYEVDGIRFMVMHGHDVDQAKLNQVAEALSLSPIGVTLTGTGEMDKSQQITASVNMSDESTLVLDSVRSYNERVKVKIKLLSHHHIDIRKVRSIDINGTVVGMERFLCELFIQQVIVCFFLA